jgi:hypothetical protein
MTASAPKIAEGLQACVDVVRGGDGELYLVRYLLTAAEIHALMAVGVLSEHFEIASAEEQLADGAVGMLAKNLHVMDGGEIH